MKQVTIDNVRERIAELEMVNSHGELSLRGEFELACLRRLVAMMYTQTAAATADELRAQGVDIMKAKTLQSMHRIRSSFDAETWAIAEQCLLGLVDGCEVVANELRTGTLPERFRPQPDDTAPQQFEALATSSKSEHLLNAERIAREAQTLSDRPNVTSVVHDRVSGWSERQQKVIAYSLWRFSYTAHQQANQAAQANNKDMFDRFIRDARCAEEIREEFTSAWVGKL